jgi:hypothetical protein
MFLISYSAMSEPVLAQNPTSQTWDTHATDHFEIYYQSQQRGHVEAVAREAERAYARISFTLRHELAAKVPLILVRQERDLPRNEVQARALVIASGAPARDHLLMSTEGFEKRPGIALTHELMHQFVFELLPQAQRDAPWVSEALPDHYSGSWTPSDLARVRNALLHGTIPTVEDLTASDRQWGHALFDFVAAEYGARGIRQYLPALRGSQRPPDAVRAAFSVSPDDFNAAFQRYVRTYFGER